MTKTTLKVFAGLVIGVAIGLGIPALQAQAPAGGCDEWQFMPSMVAHGGFLLCPGSGELWEVDNDEKKLVQPK